MSVIQADLATFPALKMNEEFNINSVVYSQLYELEKQYHLSEGNTLELPTVMHDKKVMVRDYLNADNLSIYNSYGVYLGDGARATSHKCLFIISSELFKSGKICDTLEEKKTALDVSMTLDYCVIELSREQQADFYKNETDEEISNDITKFFTEYDIVNPGIELNTGVNVLDRLQKEPCLNGSVFINMYPILYKNQCLVKMFDHNSLTKRLMDVVTELHENYDKESIVFYLEIPSGNSKSYCAECTVLYTGLAAYLAMKYGYRFDIPSNMVIEYQQHIKDFYNANNRYLSKYIEYLKDPLKTGVKSKFGNPAFLYRRVHSEDDKLVLIMDAIEIERDEIKTFVIKNTDVQKLKINASFVNEMHFTDFYEIHSKNFSVAHKQAAELHNFLSQAQEIFNFKDVSLDCSNTFIANIGGKLMLCFVRDLACQYKYNVQSITNEFKAVVQKSLNAFDIINLIDLRAFADYPLLMSRETLMSKSIPIDDTSDGLIFAIGHNRQVKMTSECNLYYDSIGLWDAVTKFSRGTKVKKFVNCGVPIKGLRHEFLSFFGGTHPYITDGKDKPTLNIGQEMWR